MAQLRDAKTSELLFEGTPYQAVKEADKRGRDTVLFDDVGLAFDPDAVLAFYDENADSLKTLKRAPKKNAEIIEGLEATLAAQAPDDSE